jgi:hypothetical protein
MYAHCGNSYLGLAMATMCLNHMKLLCKMLYMRTYEEHLYRSIRQNEQRKQTTKQSLHISWTNQCVKRDNLVMCVN